MKEVIRMENRSRWKGIVGENGPLWVYFLLVLTICISASIPAMGASSGTTGAAFLKVSVGPRPAAMGSAYTAVAEEPYALHYNPASISSTDRWDLSAMHQDQFGQVRFDYFGLAAPAIKNRSAWGVSFIRMAIDDYARTENDDGIKFTNADIAISATYAHRILKPLSIGISGKMIKQTLSIYTANGWAVDVGTHLKVNSRLSLGAALLHIGPKITFISIGDPLPTVFRVGGAFKLLPRGNLLATMDYWVPKDDAKGVGFGMEYRPSRFVAFRGGYQLGSSFTGFNASTYGVTFDFENFGIEYAFVPREKLGDVHRAGLNVSFGGKKPQVVASRQESPYRRGRSPRRTRGAAEEDRSRAAETAPEARGTRHRAEGSSEASPVFVPVQKAAPKAASAVVEEPPRAGSMSDMMSLRTTASASPSAVESPASVPAERPYYELPLIEKEVGVKRETPEAITVRPVRQEQMTEDVVAEKESTLVQAEGVPAVSPAPAQSKEAIVQEKTAIATGLMKEQRYLEASVILRSALSEDPRNVPLWYLLSESLYKNGEYDRAMEAVNNALTIIHGGRSGAAP